MTTSAASDAAQHPAPSRRLVMFAVPHSPLRRNLVLFAAALAVAATAFWATVLVSPPQSQASVGAPVLLPYGVGHCDVLPTGDTAMCDMEN